MLSVISFWLLFSNGLCDCSYVACMLVEIILGRTSFISHFSLWLAEEDRANRAAKILFTFFVLEWGMIRIIAAIYDDAAAALITYGAEGLLAAVGMYDGIVDYRKGAVVCLLSIACALVLVLT